jgi:hypothetical protein
VTTTKRTGYGAQTVWFLQDIERFATEVGAEKMLSLAKCVAHEFARLASLGGDDDLRELPSQADVAKRAQWRHVC